jgi:hypothetical protein
MQVMPRCTPGMLLAPAPRTLGGGPSGASECLSVAGLQGVAVGALGRIFGAASACSHAPLIGRRPQRRPLPIHEDGVLLATATAMERSETETGHIARIWPSSSACGVPLASAG